MQAIKCVVVGDGWVTIPISTLMIQGRQIYNSFLVGKQISQLIFLFNYHSTSRSDQSSLNHFLIFSSFTCWRFLNNLQCSINIAILGVITESVGATRRDILWFVPRHWHFPLTLPFFFSLFKVLLVRHACSSVTPQMPFLENIYPQCKWWITIHGGAS